MLLGTLLWEVFPLGVVHGEDVGGSWVADGGGPGGALLAEEPR
jgi:hypothetical protein